MASVEFEKRYLGIESQFKIKNYWNITKRHYEFGRFSVVELPGAFVFRDIFSIPIPFLDRDIGFLKFENKWSFHWRK